MIGTLNGVPRFGAPLPTPTSNGRPRPYQPGLTPAPSRQRPHCLAKDRLLLWIPVNPGGINNEHTVTGEDLDRVRTVMSASLSESTRGTYGAGLLTFHVYCDLKGVTEEERCPAHPKLILSFIAACAGSYSRSALTNHVCSVQAWHLLHGAEWRASEAEVQTALEGAARLAPKGARRPKRDPFTIDIIERLCAGLDRSKPADAAIDACLKVAFFGMARLGELVLPNLKAFDPGRHVKRSDVTDGEDREGNKVSVIFLPWTKVAPEGEDIYFAKQGGASDPTEALANHLRVNELPSNMHLFAYKTDKGPRVLTRTTFTKRLNEIARGLDIGNLKFHGIRIGSVLEYLLRGIPIEVVKVMGRWGSDAFAIYLRKHAAVLARYLQDSPALEEVTRITVALPPVR